MTVKILYFPRERMRRKIIRALRISQRKLKDEPQDTGLCQMTQLGPVTAGQEVGIVQIGEDVRDLYQTVVRGIEVGDIESPDGSAVHGQFGIQLVFQKKARLGFFISFVELEGIIFMGEKAVAEKEFQS